jgi:hypothetical protein
MSPRNPQSGIGWWTAFVPGTLGLVSMSVMLLLPKSWTNVGLIFGVYVLSLVGYVLVIVRHSNRLRAAMRASGNRMCIKCLYPLQPSESGGVCPECGTPFPPDANKSAWDAIHPRP